MIECKPLVTHVFDLNPDDNGGESILVSTEIYRIGNSFQCFSEISLQSYSNSASINLGANMLSPENLRKLADELENEITALENEAERT